MKAPAYDVVVLTTRVAVREADVGPMLNKPELVGDFVPSILGDYDQDQEVFGFLALDLRHRVIGYKVMTVGTDVQAPVNPRQVWRQALAMGASAVVLFHTHPTGDVLSSLDDIGLTRRFVEAGEVLGVPVYDHVIFEPSSWRWHSIRSTNGKVFLTGVRA